MKLTFVEGKLIENFRKLSSKEQRHILEEVETDVINKPLFDEYGNYLPGKSGNDYVRVNREFWFQAY